MVDIDWKTAPSFIETQFPVSKLSKESFGERDAKNGQTLTGLGKWWGRKPLVLVRATVLGLLLPSTRDPVTDRAVFQALMTIDDEGFERRRSKPIPQAEVYRFLQPPERVRWFEPLVDGEKVRLKRGLTRDERERLQQLAFSRMPYDERLGYCSRPEHIAGPSAAAWTRINRHLGTTATSIPELVAELGQRRFGGLPRVGDAFCGGGSVPFEAARIGCAALGSDLNPMATLMTWAALHVAGAGANAAPSIERAQQRLWDEVGRTFSAWGVETNDAGWRADAFLYCVEVVCPECRWTVPLSGTWCVSDKYRAAAFLVEDPAARSFVIDIRSDLSPSEYEAHRPGSARDARLVCPHCGVESPMSMVRGDRRGDAGAANGLRRWDREDVEGRTGEPFTERLYCIRWVERWVDDDGKPAMERHYCGVGPSDHAREAKVRALLAERFEAWQREGFIPNQRILPGAKTDEPIRTRGWTWWHHLYTPRQLLLLGTMSEAVAQLFGTSDPLGRVVGALALGRCADHNSRLCRWHLRTVGDKSEGTFSNQALNTMYNYAARGLDALEDAFRFGVTPVDIAGTSTVLPSDARKVEQACDYWITDPPYADAIMYHELTEYFLVWYAAHIQQCFPGWYADSRRALAVTGEPATFRRAMVETYRNLAAKMPENGRQVVMFTHQDAGVWADLAVILWAAGLSVSAAWCIATETPSALKEGNYVQGTVILVLRKQTSDDTAFLDEVHPQVEDEVRAQLASMLALEDTDDPNFGDSDYQLAAYAAALRVLTRYRGIEDINVEDQLTRVRQAGERNPIEELIADAVRTACDFLIPKGFSGDHWKQLGPEERLYLKALEVETHGEHRSGVYMELARGFRVKEYKALIETGKANQTRLKTATEFGARELGTAGFGSSTIRAVLFAVRETVRASDPQVGKAYLRDGLPDYWPKRVLAIAVLDYLSNLGVSLPHWTADADAARLLAGALRNDSV